ncbi:MAG: hypothetical protein J1F07_01055 [Muribaculaceae bacterium]|nr:hypothetical protein [Muribaculaceae bacterium]
MITTTALFIGKLLLMLLIIGGMVMVLMGIGHLFHTDDLNTSDDDLRLRDEVDNEENVVGEKSVFYNFLVTRRDEDRQKDRTD